MAMYYPTVDEASLQPSNPFYGPLKVAIEELKDAQDTFWEAREEYWDDEGQGTSENEIKNKLEDTIGDEPWRYRNIFNGVSPSRRTGGSARLVFVDADFTPKAVLWERDGEDYVLTDDDIGSMTSGNPDQDTLFTNNRIFGGGGATYLGYYIRIPNTAPDGGDWDYLVAPVYERYDEVPYAWNASSGYSQQELQLLNYYGNAWRDACNPALNNYRDLLDDYNGAGGGDIDDDYFSGTIDRPWEGYEGSNVSYMRPQDLPGQFVREIRGENV